MVHHSAPLAGLVTFLSISPGNLVSPIAGALLDRHGRRRLIILDFMELRRAPLLWRGILEGWILGVSVLVFAVYWLGQ